MNNLEVTGRLMSVIGYLRTIRDRAKSNESGTVEISCENIDVLLSALKDVKDNMKTNDSWVITMKPLNVSTAT